MAMKIALCFLLLFVMIVVSQSKVLKLSCAQIRAFVDGHNNYRLSIAKGEVPDQPAASEMQFMIWDEELADKASKWASKHKFSHNPNRSVDSKRFTTGENIYKISSTNKKMQLNVSSALRAWFNEHNYYTYGPLSPSNFHNSKKAIGHYTQMIWYNTIYVGCAVSQRTDNKKTEYIVVCDYGPAGNYYRQTPYKSGSPRKQLLCATNDCSRPYGYKC